LNLHVRPRYPVGNLGRTTERIEETLTETVQGALVRAVHGENLPILGIVCEILLRVVGDEPLDTAERRGTVLLVEDVYQRLPVGGVAVKVVDRSEKQF